MKASNALVAAALAGVFAAGTSLVSAAPTIEHSIKADEKKDDCPGKKKDKDDCPGKKKEEKKGTIL